MPEWSIGTVSKTVVRVTVPRVRIPLFPLIRVLISKLCDLHPLLCPKSFSVFLQPPPLFFTFHPSFAVGPKKATAASTRSRCRGYRNEIKILLFVDFLPAVFERYCAVEHKMLLRRVLFVGREVADALELEVCPRLCVLCEERLYLSVFHNFD